MDQILYHAQRRLELLSCIPTSDDESFIGQIKCPPVSASLDKLWMAEHQLADINDATSLGGRDMFAIKQAHRGVRACCRNIFADKGSYEIIINHSTTVSKEFMTFIDYLAKLQVHIKTRLVTTVEDEASSRLKLHDLTEKVRKNEEIRDLLQTKLSALREEKAKVISNLDQILRKLQREKEDLTSSNQLELDLILKDTTEAISKATSEHEVHMRQLQDTVESLDRQLSEVMKKNRDEEQILRKDKTRTEKDLNAKIAQYDDEMEDKRRSQDEIIKLFEAEKAEYAVLKEHFDRVDCDNKMNSEEDTILDATQCRDDFVQMLMAKAATKIQSIFRRKFSRDVLKLKEKLAKKKKKGGKKGGKKGAKFAKK